MSQTTRCPHCATTFRVVADQLRISEGWVRCGHCKEIFDAAAHLQALQDPQPGQAAAPPKLPGEAPEAVPTAETQPPPLPAVARSPDAPHVWRSARTIPATATTAQGYAPEGQTPVPVPTPPAQFLVDAAAGPAPDEGAWRPPAALPSIPPFLRAGAGQEEAAAHRQEAMPEVPAPERAPQEAPAEAAWFGPLAPPDRPTRAAGMAKAERAPGTAEAVVQDDSGWNAVAEAEAAAAANTGADTGADTGAAALSELPAADTIAEVAQERDPDMGAFGDPGSSDAPRQPLSLEPAVLPVNTEAVVCSPGPQVPLSSESEGVGSSASDRDQDGPAWEATAEPQFVRTARRSAFWRQPVVRVLLAWLVLVLAALLALQVLVRHRDGLAARHGGLQGMLQQLCGPLDCTLQPPRDISAIVIDSSSFVRSLTDATRYELRVDLRNTAAQAVATPLLELTLTDSLDQPLVRRVLQPQQELGAPAGLDAGAAWSASVPVQVMGRQPVAGYRLLAFYP